jgi:cytochrome c oxidase subunit 2
LKINNRKIPRISYFVILIAILVLGTGVSYFMANQPTKKEFTIEASRYKFTPGIIVVNKGDEVVLKIKSLDVTHGIYIGGYEIDKTLPALVTVTLSFTADVSGNFKLRCSVTCGNFHPYMIGELRVQPNVLFYSSLLVAGVIGVGMVSKSYEEAKSMAERGVVPLTELEVLD